MDDLDNEGVMRLAGRLLLDQITVARLTFDLVDALIVVAITQANVEPVSRDVVLQRRYATFDQSPPNELRRPISVNAVAHSLGMPFETVRRRLVKMSRLGVFKTTKQGIYFPTRIVPDGRHRAALELGYARIKTLHEALVLDGWGQDYGPASPWAGESPLRLVARVSSDYLLRFVHLLMEETGDPVAAAVWLAIFCDSPAVADQDRRTARSPNRPLTQAALARRLRLPGETTRRRIHELAEMGLCSQSSRGVMVTASVLARPGVQRLLKRNRHDLRRMFSTLAEFGIPQAWRAEAAGSSVAA